MLPSSSFGCKGVDQVGTAAVDLTDLLQPQRLKHLLLADDDACHCCRIEITSLVGFKPGCADQEGLMVNVGATNLVHSLSSQPCCCALCLKHNAAQCKEQQGAETRSKGS